MTFISDTVAPYFSALATLFRHYKTGGLDLPRRSRLVERGFEQARRFSWERTAQQVLDAYEEIGSYKKRPR
jgi:glycosyltransferase involved in cell wall biosynthesis